MAGSFSFDFVLLITAEVLAEDPVVAGTDALGVDSRSGNFENPLMCPDGVNCAEIARTTKFWVLAATVGPVVVLIFDEPLFNFDLLVTDEVLAEDPVVASTDALGVDSRSGDFENPLMCPDGVNCAGIARTTKFWVLAATVGPVVVLILDKPLFNFDLLVTAEVPAENPDVAGADALGVENPVVAHLPWSGSGAVHIVSQIVK